VILVSTNSKRPDETEYESVDWMLSVDDRLLDHFEEHGPGLCPQAAGVLGLHVSFAQRRCDMLCEHGFLHESDTEYYLTDRGQQYIEVRDQC
jgi:hypothetical protein